MEFSSSILKKVRRNAVIKCPLCSSKKKIPFEIDRRVLQFKAVQCKICGLIYMDSVVHSDDMHLLYNGYNAGRNRIDKKLEVKRKVMYKLDRAFTMDQIDRKSTTAILDIGGGAGDFLSLFPKAFKKFIIEVDRKAVERGQKQFKSITFFSSQDEVGIDQQFDHIIFRGTLQYMTNLNQTSEFCRKHLKRGGSVILLAIPNADSLLAQIQREHWSLFNRIEHRYCFGLKQLERLFGDDFKLARYEFPYLGTPYENYSQDLTKLIDIFNDKKKIKLKFPFWGSMLNAVLIKQ
jgi:16S rRNA G527 N7-methylase RsmG